MKYSINYQFMQKTAARPCDDGEALSIQINDQNDFGLLPNVGDYVNIQNPESSGLVSFCGKVKSKYFNYISLRNDDSFCLINIVVEEIPDDEIWGALIKE
jgi:hypothetical protein